VALQYVAKGHFQTHASQQIASNSITSEARASADDRFGGKVLGRSSAGQQQTQRYRKLE
jgi:hypothetical protein